jgi:hypothetical protein
MSWRFPVRSDSCHKQTLTLLPGLSSGSFTLVIIPSRDSKFDFMADVVVNILDVRRGRRPYHKRFSAPSNFQNWSSSDIFISWTVFTYLHHVKLLFTFQDSISYSALRPASTVSRLVT